MSLRWVRSLRRVLWNWRFFLLFLSVGFETRSQLTGFDKGVRHARFWFGFYYRLGSVARVTRACLLFLFFFAFFLFGLLSGLVNGSIWNVERNGSDKWNDENCVGGVHDVRTDAPVDSIFFLWIRTVDLGHMLWTAWNGRGEYPRKNGFMIFRRLMF